MLRLVDSITAQFKKVHFKENKETTQVIDFYV